jgi:AmiR/NasT family two-component response regulator
MQGRVSGGGGSTIASAVLLAACLPIAALRRRYALERAVRARRVITAAKSILMVRHVCSDEEAFHLLVELAGQQNLLVAQIAASVIRHPR